MLNTIPSLVVILNGERQILLANTAVENLARALHRESYEGMRPGEFLSCHHAASAGHGCGTTEACRTCGAVQAILAANAGQQMSKECRIVTVDGTAFDLRVTASPFEWQDRSYVFLVIEDISHEKRRHLLERVLANMLKNALEASVRGGVVWLGADVEPAACTFWCHNEGGIPREVALQIFQRSFSTKGRGRGIGTYSIKLLGERYLGGQASFTTSAAEGTRFQLRLPRG